MAQNWNVVVTAISDRWQEARTFAAKFGSVTGSSFYNVLLLTVDDIDRFLEDFAAAAGQEDPAAHGIGHVFPARETFTFSTREDFEEKVVAAGIGLASILAGKRFHVRMHRRGFKGTLSSPEEERLMDTAILRALADAGTPGEIDFEDPDMVIDLETVGNRAGVSLWTRDDLYRYPFLRIE